MPLYKELEQSEGGYFTLTQLSLAFRVKSDCKVREKWGRSERAEFADRPTGNCCMPMKNLLHSYYVIRIISRLQYL